MKLVHVTIQTKHFEDEINFFEKYIGLKIVQRIQGMEKNIVFLSGEEGGSNIEIIENTDAENSGNGNLSLGFKTEDVESKREEMISDGYEVSPMISPMPEVKFFFVKDPAGVTIQFM